MKHITLQLEIKFIEFLIHFFHKNELYFGIISFQNEANRVYVSDIDIVVFKLQS